MTTMWSRFFLLLVIGCLNVSNLGASSPRSNKAFLLLSCHGGGINKNIWSNLFKNPQAKYRKSLEEPVKLLDRQLRTAHEEAAQLRHSCQETRAAQRKATYSAELKIYQTTQAALQKEIASLEKRILKLETVKKELESLLQQQQETIASLQQVAVEHDANYKKQVTKAQEELERVRTELLEKSKWQLEEMEKVMKQRIAHAILTTQQEALAEQQAKLKELRQEMETKAQANLQKQQSKSELAIEKERVKMRKLVKALAQREEKMMQTNNKKKNKSSAVITNRGSGTFVRRNQNTPLVGNVRGSSSSM